MIYLITSGCYSDYRVNAVLDGPDDADLDALQREWVQGLSDTQTLEIDSPAFAFIAWLAARDGWRERATSEHNTGDYRMDAFDQRQQAIVARFGTGPAGVCSPPGYAPRDHHNWHPRITEDGQAYWWCGWCKDIAPVSDQ